MMNIELPRKFIVLTTQRSGSNYFCFWLNNHPSIRCHSELFLGKYIGMDGFCYYCDSDRRRRLLHKVFGGKLLARMPGNLILSSLIKGFYQSLLFNPTHSGPITDGEDLKFRGSYHPRENPENDRAVGFKLMYDQLEYYALLKNLVKGENIYVIHLIRNNPLKIYLSKLARRKRGIPHSVNEVEKVKVWVDPKEIIKRLDRIVRDQERMKKTFPDNPYIEITFEDFISSYPEPSKKIFDFLGVDYQCGIRMPTLKKLNPDSVRQVVENYDEIALTLEGTPYEHYLR